MAVCEKTRQGEFYFFIFTKKDTIDFIDKLFNKFSHKVPFLINLLHEFKYSVLFACVLIHSYYSLAKPVSKSAIKSFTLSNPTEIRIKFSVIPDSAFCSADKRPCVVVAG